MRITILTYGSRGDIQPFIPLSHWPMEEGHSVKLAAPFRFKSFVEERCTGPSKMVRFALRLPFYVRGARAFYHPRTNGRLVSMSLVTISFIPILFISHGENHSHFFMQENHPSGLLLGAWSIRMRKELTRSFVNL